MNCDGLVLVRFSTAEQRMLPALSLVVVSRAGQEKTVMTYYRLAADQGLAMAQCNLGAHCEKKGPSPLPHSLPPLPASLPHSSDPPL